MNGRIVGSCLGVALVASPLQGQGQQLDSTLNNYVHPEGTVTVPVGSLGRVDRHGHGPVPMILIPGKAFGGEIFRSFMEANADRYTMYAVTLPGVAGTAPPPMPPDTTSYMNPVWTAGAEEGVVRLIREEGLDRPVVVGHFLTGGLVATRLAVNHPELVRGAVVMAGEPRREIGTDEARVRRNWVDENLRPRFFRWVPRETWINNNWSVSYYSRDPELAERAHARGNAQPLPVLIQYLAEFFGSDVTPGFSDLQVPILALTPGFDREFLADTANASAKRFFIDSWARWAELRSITVRPVEGARVLMWEDEPEAVSAAVAEFVEGLERR